jgi:hypothetical protein
MASNQAQSAAGWLDEPRTAFGLPNWLLTFFLAVSTLLAY